jgi:nitrogen regulatory protein P-II 1
MKMVMAVIKPFKLDDVREALAERGVTGTDDQVEAVVEAIVKAAGTGKIGDGKVFVYDLGSVVRIRTGELDADAL